jgi:hypothetical protein
MNVKINCSQKYEKERLFISGQIGVERKTILKFTLKEEREKNNLNTRQET